MKKRAGLTLLSVLAVAGLFTVASRASAQTLRGIVVQSGFERPIPAADVMMISSTGDTIGFAITDANGFFSLSADDDGTFMLVARALGYRPMREGPYELEEDDVRIVRFNLAPRAMEIEGLVVEARDPRLVRRGFCERMEERRGYFLSPDSIVGSTAFFTQDLFKGGGLGGRTYVDPLAVPWNANVLLRGTSGGTCTPRIYVDGVFQYLGDEWDPGYSIDTAVPMDELLAVEIYQGHNEPPPRRYLSTNKCGVILFWSKR